MGGVLLVVDEDAQRAEQLDGRLTPDGMTLLHARSVSQALELLHALGSTCCMLVSMTLPGRGAWELLSRLRSDKTPEHTCALIIYGPPPIVNGEPLNEPVIAKFETPLDLPAVCEVVREHCAPKPPAFERVRTGGIY